jgi:pimeloyl-ACP methyl ester carboxylesterase
MVSFVLIHGAMHGGWCWERIVPLLEAAGHRVLAPDLPGLGQDATPASEVSLEGTARFVADILCSVPGRAILVGHSLGGMVISQAAEYAPDRIGALVYVTALLPRDGVSAVGLTRANLVEGEDRLEMRVSADRQSITVDAADARFYLYGETAEEWLSRVLPRLTPQPLEVLKTPARLTAERFGATPRIFIECLRDRVIPLHLQRVMQAESPCGSVFTIDTDHSPFYSATDALAQHLLTIATQIG